MDATRFDSKTIPWKKLNYIPSDPIGWRSWLKALQTLKMLLASATLGLQVQQAFVWEMHPSCTLIYPCIKSNIFIHSNSKIDLLIVLPYVHAGFGAHFQSVPQDVVHYRTVKTPSATKDSFIKASIDMGILTNTGSMYQKPRTSNSENKVKLKFKYCQADYGVTYTCIHLCLCLFFY